MKKIIQDLSSVLYRRYGNIPAYVWAVLAAVPLFFFSLYLDNDVIWTTKNGLTIWHMVFANKPLGEFYVTPYPMDSGTGHAYYDFFIYMIFAVWDLPLFIYEKIAGMSFVSNYIAVWYAKSIGLFFLALSAGELYKMTYDLTDDSEKAGLGCFSYIFSVIVFEAVIIIGQYDVISIFFTLCGLRAYMRKKDRAFLLWFACAIACKMFALWIFIPLLLLRFKKVWKVLCGAGCGISFILIPKIYFMLYQKISGTEVLVKGIDDTISSVFYIDAMLWSGDAPIATTFLPWFFFFTFILWVLCWFNEKPVSDWMTIYVCLLAMSIFILTCQTNAYWIILVAPYIAILEGCSWKNLRVKLFLEVCMGMSHIFWKVRSAYHCYSYNLVNNMMHFESADKELDSVGLWTCISKLSDISQISIENIFLVARSILVASFILLLVYLYPGAENREAPLEPKEAGRLFCMKAGVSMLVLLIPLIGVVIRLWYVI